MIEQRRIVRRFSAKPIEPEEEPEEEPQEDTKAEADDELEEDAKPVIRRRVLLKEVDEQRIDREPVAPPPAVKAVVLPKKTTAKKLEELANDLADDIEEDTKPVIKQMPLPEPALEKFRIRTVNETVAGDVFTQMFEAMADGASVIVTKLDSGKWQFTSTNIQAAAVVKSNNNKLSGKAYWDEVLDPAYTKFYAEWDNLTASERKARAKKVGAVWEASTNQKMDAMRMTEAYRDKMKIFKYKPEYRDMKKRAAIRG
jgi:hypothetical protein